jgi:aminocarboxymuconate-semialdehyde decarboxylase
MTFPTRRDFLMAAAMMPIALATDTADAGKASAASGGAQPASDSTARPPVRRREVVVNGRRVKTVDIHAHCAFAEACALMGLSVDPPNLVVTADRIRTMDAQGIDVEALSINPFWYAAEREVAQKLITVQNERLAELCASEPDRFVAFATVAMQYPDLAVRQLEHGIKKLGMRGMSVGTHVGTDDLSSPKFNPIWAKAEELGCLVFMHPIAAPEFERRLSGNGGLVNVIGNPLETTIALSHLIFEGTLDRYPGLKLCASHGGGYLPSYAARSDMGCVAYPDSCRAVPLKKKPTEYLRQVYYDSIVFTDEAMRHLIAEVGSSQMMMGTDHPFPWGNRSVDYILDTPGLSDAERAAVLGDTACGLLGINT